MPNVDSYVLPALALLVIVLTAYVSVRWVLGDPDTIDGSNGASDADAKAKKSSDRRKPPRAR